MKEKRVLPKGSPKFGCEICCGVYKQFSGVQGELKKGTRDGGWRMDAVDAIG